MNFNMLILAVFAFPISVTAQVPHEVVDSCLLGDSIAPRQVIYEGMSGPAEINDEEMPGYSLFSYRYKGAGIGYATSMKGKHDLIVVGRGRADILTAKRIGQERPIRFDSTKAIYGMAKHKKNNYFCVASEFEGLGRSGTFESVRAVYVALLNAKGAVQSLYFSVRDVRKIRKHNPAPSSAASVKEGV